MTLRDRKILTFDVVGTLIDFETGILGYIRPIARRAGRDPSDEAILLSYGKAEHAQQKLMPDEAFPKLLAPIYHSIAAEFDLPDDERSAAGLRLSIPDWPPFPDSIAALQQLRQHFRLVAMTNSDNWALGHFAQALGQPFHDTVTAEDVGVVKPDPQFFAYARGRQSPHGYRLDDYLHVAQSQFHDIGVAKRLGYHACWIERRQGKEGFGATPATEITKPDYHFSSLAELATAVENGQ